MATSDSACISTQDMGFVGSLVDKEHQFMATSDSACSSTKDSAGSSVDCKDLKPTLKAPARCSIAARARARRAMSKASRRSRSEQREGCSCQTSVPAPWPFAPMFAPHAKNAELLVVAQEELSASKTRATKMRQQGMTRSQSQYDVALTATLDGLARAQKAAAEAKKPLPLDTVKQYLDCAAMIETSKNAAIKKQLGTIDAAHESDVKGFDEHLKRHRRLHTGALADITKSSASQHAAHLKGAKARADAAQLALEEWKHLQQSKLTKTTSNTRRFSPSSARQPSPQGEQLERQMGLMQQALEKWKEEAAERDQKQAAQYAKARDDLENTLAALKRLADETAALLKDREHLERKAAISEEQRKLVAVETANVLPLKAVHAAAPLRAPAIVHARLAGPGVLSGLPQQFVSTVPLFQPPLLQQPGSTFVQPSSPRWSEPPAQKLATPPAPNHATSDDKVKDGMISIPSLAAKVVQELRRESSKSTTDDVCLPAPASFGNNLAGLEQKLDEVIQHVAAIKPTAAGGPFLPATELGRLESLNGRVQELQHQIASVRQQPQDNWPAVLRPVVTAVLQWWSPSEPTEENAKKQAPPSDEAAPPDAQTQEPEGEPH